MMSDTNPYQPPHSAEGSQAPVPAQSKDKHHDKLIVLATFENAMEAHCLRMELEQHGISASVSNEQSAQVIGASLFGRISAIWIEVVVLESDAERALLIKNKIQPEKDESIIPEWTCSCGETVDEGFGQCWSCMAPYNDTDPPSARLS